MTGKGKGKSKGAVVQARAEAGAVVQARPRGGRRPGAGRRPAVEAAPRIHPLTVKVSEAELVNVKRLASEAGLTPSAWLWGLVRAALDAQGQPTQPLHAAPSEPDPSEGVPF